MSQGFGIPLLIESVGYLREEKPYLSLEHAVQIICDDCELRSEARQQLLEHFGIGPYHCITSAVLNGDES